jgi:exosortase H (IPTLxxWG-CTERM-specific)
MTRRKSKRQVQRSQAVNAREYLRTGVIAKIVASPCYRQVALFALSCIAFFSFVHAMPASVSHPMNEHTASMLGLILNAFGVPVSTAGDVVSDMGLAFQIIPECTTIFSTGLLVCFVAFHPASMRQKTIGLAWGIPILYLGNLFRLALTFMISRYDLRFFEVTHVYLGQVFTITVLILCCLFWMRWVERKNTSLEMAGNLNLLVFLARFGLISAGLFLVWLKVHHGYIEIIDGLMSFGLSLFGSSTGLARGTPLYFETFSIVIAVSLVMAASSLPWRTRFPLLGSVLGLLFFIHFFHRIDNALMVLFHEAALQRTDLVLLGIGQYLVPVLLLIQLIRSQRQDSSAVS